MAGYRKRGVDSEDAKNETKEEAQLREENKILAQQIKQLVKAESRLYEYQQELDAQLKEYKELYELSKKLNAAFEIRKIFEYTLEYIVNSLEYERVIFFHRNEDSEEFSVFALDGYYNEREKKSIEGLTIRLSDPGLTSLLEGKELIVCEAEENEEKNLLKLGEKLLLGEYLVYPLGSHSELPVLLAVGNSIENAEFYRRINNNEDDLLGVGNLVGLLSSAIENQISFDKLEFRVQERTEELAKTNILLTDEIAERKRIEEKLRELSETDSLTLIHNRRKFFELFNLEIEKCKRYNRPLSLIMFDLDHFKEINDEMGHQAGDGVLKNVSSIVSAIIRKVDVFARYGGEEFILMCPETGMNGAIVLAERIRKIIEMHSNLEICNVTVSIGVAEFENCESADSLIERTDKALYAAKNKGRNRVEIAISDSAA